MVFRSLVNNFPKGEVWHDDRPDFLVHTEDGIIGIEHSLVHIPERIKHPLQAIESQTDEIVSMAKEHAELSGVPPIHAQFHFQIREHIDRTSRINMARDIARLVYQEVSDDINPRTMMELFYPEYDDSIASIHIYKLDRNLKHFWNTARAGWSVENCIDIFQESISKKEVLFKSYIR